MLSKKTNFTQFVNFVLFGPIWIDNDRQTKHQTQTSKRGVSLESSQLSQIQMIQMIRMIQTNIEKSRAYAAYQYQSSTIAMSRAWLATLLLNGTTNLLSLQFFGRFYQWQLLEKNQDNHFKMGSSILYNVSSFHHWSLKKWQWQGGSIWFNPPLSAPWHPDRSARSSLRGLKASGLPLLAKHLASSLKVDMFSDLLVMISESPFKKKNIIQSPQYSQSQFGFKLPGFRVSGGWLAWFSYQF